MPETYLTLWRYQQLVGNTLRSNPDLQGAWVMAELSDVRVAGGHCYMELVEKDERGGMRAKMRAMIWRNTFETRGGELSPEVRDQRHRSVVHPRRHGAVAP